MSARKLGNSELFQTITRPSQPTRLHLPANAVRIRKSGIEFRSQAPLAAWTEMTVTLEAPLSAKKFHCTGVIVACEGNRHSGYTVSMVFTSLSRQAQAQLNSLAFSGLA